LISIQSSWVLRAANKNLSYRIFLSIRIHFNFTAFFSARFWVIGQFLKLKIDLQWMALMQVRGCDCCAIFRQTLFQTQNDR
jgi:hypothetical protein